MTGREESAEASVERPSGWARAADYLVFVLIPLALYILLFGGFDIQVFGLELRITSPSRLLEEAAALAALRTALRRRPSIRAHWGAIVQRTQRRLAAFDERTGWLRVLGPCAAIFAGTRLVVLIIGYMSVAAIGYPIEAPPAWRTSFDELWNLPARWDSGWYLGIAQHGYQWNSQMHGQQNVIFFPAFPLLMRAAALVGWRSAADPSQVLWAGVVVSLIAFAAATVYLFLFTRDLVGDEHATTAVLLLSAYPFALFFGAAYTESLFLLAAVAAFFHYSRGQLWRSAAWGVLAGLTRPNGWMVGVSLGLLALPAIDVLKPVTRPLWWIGLSTAPKALEHKKLLPLVVAAAAPGIGLLLYCAYTFRLTGDPFTWAHLMTYWDRDFNGWGMLKNDFAILGASGIFRFLGQTPIQAVNAMALIFAVASIWPVTRRFGLGYGLFVLVNIALPAASGGLVSIGRYSSVLFPSFIWLAAATPRPTRIAVVLLFALGQAWAAVLFFTWRPIY